MFILIKVKGNMSILCNEKCVSRKLNFLLYIFFIIRTTQQKASL